MWTFTKNVICPKDKKSLRRFKQYQEYYGVKYNIAKKYAPSTILEIGVRAGYSAYSLLSACPDAKYIGIDAENGTHGGQNGPWMWWAKKILGDFNTEFVVADSQKLSEIDGSYDFIHIDGDHTTGGVVHDLKICWPALNKGGVILVDDYDYINSVRKGVDVFASKSCLEKKYIKSLRGEIVFENGR